METLKAGGEPIEDKADVAVIGHQLTYYDQEIDLMAVTAIRYGWRAIRLDMFRIGGCHLLELKTPDRKLRMNFRSYFGLFERRQSENFHTLLNAVFDMTVARLVNAMIDALSGHKTVTIGNCEVNQNGILLKNFHITWDDLSYQKNYNKLTINSKSNQGIWTNLYYTETDNVQVLMYFLDWKFSAGDK